MVFLSNLTASVHRVLEPGEQSRATAPGEQEVTARAEGCRENPKDKLGTGLVPTAQLSRVGAAGGLPGQAGPLSTVTARGARLLWVPSPACHTSPGTRVVYSGSDANSTLCPPPERRA